MAKFSRTEARASNIVRMEKKMNGSTFVGWVFGVTDVDGNYHDWLDTSTSDRATKPTIKTAIETHLKDNVEKKSAPVVHTFTDVEDKGKGETVG
tara:strand:- start:162 stop:443 length:282 start_codon:yes stop_codon:yes gene_type:complete